jgi:hypothetical protein
LSAAVAGTVGIVVRPNSVTPERLPIATPGYDPVARSQRGHSSAFVENASAFGGLSRAPRFVEAYRWVPDSLHTRGARATLEVLLHGFTRWEGTGLLA